MLQDDGIDGVLGAGDALPEDALVAALSGGGVGEVSLVADRGVVVTSVRPRTVHELSRLVGLVSRARGKVAVTRRFASGLAAVDPSGLASIEAPDEVSCIVRVGAGAMVRDVEARAIQAGLSLGPLLPSTQTKTVGAWLSGPTRGERAVPPGRLETAALALEAVLPDGGVYRSREVPRSAAGPDLDHLLLGGEGRFGILTRATLRLFPRALVESAAATRAGSLLEALEATRGAVHGGLAPVETRWDRARGIVEARFVGSHAARRARSFGSEPIGGRNIRGHLELAGSWKAWGAASPLRADAIQLVALNADGAFGALEFTDPEDAERAAVHARVIGFTVVSPRRLRPSPESGWTGAHDAFERLARALDPQGVFARW